MIKSQIVEAKLYIEKKSPHFFYVESENSSDDIITCILTQLDLVAVRVKCGFHGDQHPDKGTVFLMTLSECQELEAIASKLNGF